MLALAYRTISCPHQATAIQHSTQSFSRPTCACANECVTAEQQKLRTHFNLLSSPWMGRRSVNNFCARQAISICVRASVCLRTQIKCKQKAYSANGCAYSLPYPEHTWWCLIMCNCVLCRVLPSYYIWHCLRVCGLCATTVASTTAKVKQQIVICDILRCAFFVSFSCQSAVHGIN